MTDIMNTSPFFWTAVRRIDGLLPALIGQDWPTVGEQVDKLIKTLAADPSDDHASTQLLGLLAQYEPARQRLNAELITQEIVSAHLRDHLKAMGLSANGTSLYVIFTALKWSVDLTTLPSGEELKYKTTTRAITLKRGGINGAKSVKFQNLEVDLNELIGVSGAVMLIGHSMVDQPSMLAIAGGFLALIATLRAQMEIVIDPQDATVFWGMIQAIGPMKGAGLRLSTIVETTNAERAKYSLEALTDLQVRASLIKLEQLGSIAKSGETYRLIEQFTLED